MKDEIRRRVLAKRMAAPQAERFKASFAIAERFMALPFAETTKNIGLYCPLLHKGEVDARILHRFLRGTGVPELEEGRDVRISYPRTEGEHCNYYVVDSLSDLLPGKFGVREPTTNTLANPEVVVIPGIAFDRFGNRIGFGHGFFDRTIKALKPRPTVVALGYDLQVVEPIQRELWDEPYDYLVTETETIAVTTKESN